MSFQHFSTIFLSTTAGWWGWGGCWWGWKASFIKPMRPAPLLGFPAINSVSNRGLAPGLRVTTRDYSWRVLRQNVRRFAPRLHRTPGLIWRAKPVGEQNKKKKKRSCGYATQLANKLHLKRSLSLIPTPNTSSGNSRHVVVCLLSDSELPLPFHGELKPPGAQPGL